MLLIHICVLTSPGAIYRPNDLLFIIPAKANLYVQGWAKGWALGCVNPASWLPLAARHEFTQPRAHLIAQLYICILPSLPCWP